MTSTTNEVPRVHPGTLAKWRREAVKDAANIGCPLAVVRARLTIGMGRKHQWLLRVDACPWCGEPHGHGGGSDPDPKSLADYMGHRVADCFTHPNSGPGYVLIPAREGFITQKEMA